jgi:hypothetical protein
MVSERKLNGVVALSVFVIHTTAGAGDGVRIRCQTESEMSIAPEVPTGIARLQGRDILLRRTAAGTFGGTHTLPVTFQKTVEVLRAGQINPAEGFIEPKEKGALLRAPFMLPDFQLQIVPRSRI